MHMCVQTQANKEVFNAVTLTILFIIVFLMPKTLSGQYRQPTNILLIIKLLNSEFQALQSC